MALNLFGILSHSVPVVVRRVLYHYATLSITTLSIMRHIIMTVRIKSSFVEQSMNDNVLN